MADQSATDAQEADAAARYRRQRELAELVADASRRAEAMARLELSLVYGSVGGVARPPRAA